MMIGDIVVHGRVEQRKCKAARETQSGSIEIWDTVPHKSEWANIGNKIVLAEFDEYGSKNIIEPDVVASADEWTRIERKGHSFKHTSPQAIRERAKERDDVDEDNVSM